MRGTVGIVGTGWVGSSVAISTLHMGVANRLWLCDARQQIAEGEALDLSQGASFYPSAKVEAVELAQTPSSSAPAAAVSPGKAGSTSCARMRPSHARSERRSQPVRGW